MISQLKKANYRSFLILCEKNNLSRDEIEECIYMKVDAIITFLVPNDDAILLAKNTNVPVLLFGRNDDRGYLYCYSSNDFEGGQIASKYLINEKCNDNISKQLEQYKNIKEIIDENKKEKIINLYNMLLASVGAILYTERHFKRDIQTAGREKEDISL